MDALTMNPGAGPRARARLDWRVALLLVLTPTLVGYSGCSFFRPARPELPNGGFVARYTDPDTTLETIVLAIQDRAATNGASAYSGAFADTASDPRGFDAFFDPATLARYPSPQTVWAHDKEVAFYPKFCQIIKTTATYQMVWSPDPNSPDDQRTSTTALLHRQYRVTAIPAGADTALFVAWGYADLQFQLMAGNWKIVSWQDREDPTVTDSLRTFGQVSYGQRRQESLFSTQ
jgi:hypothetical protein